MYLEAKELLSAEWLINRKDKRYIWISDCLSEYESAQFLFSYMLRRQIYIDGFVTDSLSLVGLKMYHKTIIDVDASRNEAAVIVYDPLMGRYRNKIAEIGAYARGIHSDIDKENVVIWGAGITGEWAWKVLTENGINVLYFVDSNEKLAGTVKCNLLVHMPDRLEENVTVVEALENWKQLDEEIGEKYSKRFYFSLKKPLMKFDCNINGKNQKIFDLTEFWNFNFFENKRVYIFGNGDTEKTFATYLILLDYHFAGFLIEQTDQENGKHCNGYSVKYVEEILRERNFYIWMYGKERAFKVERLGLRQFTDYICHVDYVGLSRGRKDCLDVNLGNNYYLDGARYPGIMVYGTEQKNNYKIAVLGNSTSDGAMYPFKSWPELLYEELQCNNLTIYNGGVYGYTSGQELIRLVRDILPLEPDMVIVFDGYNDTWCQQEYPFGFLHMQRVFDYARNHVEDPNTGEACDDVCLGVTAQSDKFGNWMNNVRSMYAIANERKIEFYSFCQPMLVSKEVKTEKEKNMLMSMPISKLHRKIRDSFRKAISQMGELPDYMYDLSHIFDGREDIYMDYVHVWEEGNRIIAKEIAKIITPIRK